MSMTVGEIVATFDVDPSGATAGITQAELAVAGLRRDVDGTLRDARGDAVRRSAEIGQAIGLGIRSNLDEALSEFHPQILVDANSRPAERDVADLFERIQRLRATVDVDVPADRVEREVGEIRAELQALAASHPNVTVQTNAANALAALELTQRAVADLNHAHPNIRIQTNAPTVAAGLAVVNHQQQQLGNTSGPAAASSAMGSLAQSVMGVLGAIGPMPAMLVAGADAAAGLGAALVDIVPAAAVAATAVLSVAQAAASIKIGLSGVGGALKAALSPPSGGGGGGAAGAVNQLKNAEMALASAQRQEKQAQDALTQARQQAARDLVDMANSVTDAQLSQRQAVLDVQQAQQQLTADRAKGGQVTSDQLAQDQLAYDQAVQHLKEQQIQTQRLTQDNTKAQKAGVDGSQKVQSAQEQLKSAQDAVIRAQEALRQGAGGAAGGVNQLAAAMAKLAPAARAFVQEVIALRPAWSALQLDVQQRLFAGLAGSLGQTASALLPTLRRELVASAGAVNGMGLGVLATARELGASGTFGSAMHSASAGLQNLVAIPGLVLRSFFQLASAGGPQFQRFTQSIANGAASVAGSLGRAFQSGALTSAINTAVGLIKQLITVVSNAGSVIMSIFQATSQSGGGFVNTLLVITGALKQAFASPAVQAGLRALFTTMAAISQAAAPLLLQALQVIAPVLSALGPPIRVLISALAAGLHPIIAALGPVLLAAAQAIGSLAVAIAPLLTMAGQLIAMVGPVLTPVLAGLQMIFKQLAPPVLALGRVIMAILSPVLAALPSIIRPVVSIITTLTGAVLPVITQLLTALSPALTTVGQTIGQLVTAIAPLLTVLGQLIGDELQALLPILTPIIKLVGQLASLMAGQLASIINRVVIPAIRFVTDLLSGNFHSALGDAKNVVLGLGKVLLDIPSIAIKALGDIGSALISAGASLIRGFIHGIESMFGSVQSKLGELTNALTSWKGPPAVDARILTGNGQLVMQGFMAGIDKEVPNLHRQLGGITTSLPGLTLPGLRSGASRIGSTAYAQQHGGGFTLLLRIGDQELGELLVDPIRRVVKSKGRGSVQATFGLKGVPA